MNTPPNEQPLIERLVAPLRMPRWGFALVVAALAALLMVLALAVPGLSDHGQVWRLGMQPAVALYILGVYPLLNARWAPAVQTLNDMRTRAGCALPAPPVGRPGEWSALLAGVVFSVFVSFPLRPPETWLRVYEFAANGVLFGLLALAIYGGVLRTRQLARLVGADLPLDLFDRQSLMPLSRWGQSVSLTFVGGACLSLVFQSAQSLNTVASVVIYSVMVTVALGLFFSSNWRIHVALVAARELELVQVRRRLQAVRRELRQQLTQNIEPGADPDVAGPYRPTVVLALYEQQVLEASTWPFNPKIVKQLLASAAAPILIYALKISLGWPSGF